MSNYPHPISGTAPRHTLDSATSRRALPGTWKRHEDIKECRLINHIGIKEYSDWPTIPQLYVEKEFVGGCDILTSMHQNGELAKLLEEKNALAKEE